MFSSPAIHSPATVGGRYAFILYSLAGLGLMGYAITSFAKLSAARRAVGLMKWVDAFERAGGCLPADGGVVANDSALVSAGAASRGSSRCCKCWRVCQRRGGPRTFVAGVGVTAFRRIPCFRRRTVETQQLLGTVFQVMMLVMFAATAFGIGWGDAEGINFVDLVYFTVVTATTIGTPLRPATRCDSHG